MLRAIRALYRLYRLEMCYLVKNFVFFLYSLSVTEKNRENEYVEGQIEGNSALAVDSAPVEFESHDMADVEQMKMTSCDEVCAVWAVMLQ